MDEIIAWETFAQVELRVGTIVAARPNEKARQPAYVLQVDLGPLGYKQSSAQLTGHYTPEALLGRRVLCVCNFASKRIAGIKSEILVTGAIDAEGKVVLAEFALPVENGARLA